MSSYFLLKRGVQTQCISTKTKHPVLTRRITNPKNPFSAPKFWSPGPYPKTGLTVEGMQMGQAFTTWYNASIAALSSGSPTTAAATRRGGGSHGAATHRYIETCDIHTCGTDGRGKPGQCQ